jgi:hypothetical protein
MMPSGSKKIILRLAVPVQGSRFDSKAGEQRRIVWRLEVPRVVAQARAHAPIDWGGSMVRFGDYEVIHDSESMPDGKGVIR